MKRLAGIVVMVLLCSQAEAATFTFTIPDAKLQEFKDAILAIDPVPDADGDGTPDFTENAWLKQVILTQIKILYRNGREALNRAANPTVTDPDIVQ